MVKTAPSLNDEEAREILLKYLHERWRNPTGMDSAKVKINEIRKAMKAKGIDRAQVIRNLQYLIETNWVKPIVKVSTFSSGNRLVNSESTSYMISSQGIEYFEGKSKFQKGENLAGIRIENVSGIVSIGDRNLIRQEYVPLYKMLDDLSSKLRLSDKLTDTQKLEASYDVKTIQDELVKEKPDKEIVKRKWGALTNAIGTAGLQAVAEKVKDGITYALGQIQLPF